jgi:4'-phosphopantetheinyl transferase
MRETLPPLGELPPRGTIDIWMVSLASFAEESEHLDHILSSDERSRSTHFRLIRDSRRFRGRRAALRMALSRYLDQPASKLLLTTGAFGKPSLACESPLRFNLAHSEDLAVMAFTTTGEVGIDLEAVTGAEISAGSIAASYFTAREAVLVRQQRSVDAQVRTFLRLWVRKEAVFKAIGCGLSSKLDSIDVARSNIVLVRAGSNAALDSQWRVEDLDFGCDFMGAVAGPPHNWVVRQRALSNRMVRKENLWGKNPITMRELPSEAN